MFNRGNRRWGSERFMWEYWIGEFQLCLCEHDVTERHHHFYTKPLFDRLGIQCEDYTDSHFGPTLGGVRGEYLNKKHIKESHGVQ